MPRISKWIADWIMLQALREEDRGQSLASFDGRFIRPAPGLEELHQLLARAVVVPFAVALDDLEQLGGRLAALAGRVQRGRQIEARLKVARICRDLLFELAEGAERGGLLGKVERGLHGLH